MSGPANARRPQHARDDLVTALVAAADDSRFVTFEQVVDQLNRLAVDDADLPEVLERVFEALEAQRVEMTASSEPSLFPPDYAGFRVIDGGRR